MPSQYVQFVEYNLWSGTYLSSSLLFTCNVAQHKHYSNSRVFIPIIITILTVRGICRNCHNSNLYFHYNDHSFLARPYSLLLTNPILMAHVLPFLLKISSSLAKGIWVRIELHLGKSTYNNSSSFFGQYVIKNIILAQ